MAEQKRKYTEWVACPSKFEKESQEPACLKRVTKIFRAGSVEGTGKFGHGAHSAWETFQDLVATKDYQATI